MIKESDFLNGLVGKWLLTGMMGDVPLRQRVSADWTLGKKYLRMYCKSVTRKDNPTWDYEAVYHIGYSESEDLFVFHLLDTTDVPIECVVGTGRREGNGISFLFRYGDSRFNNTLTHLAGQDEWRFLQTYEEDGEIHTFATKEMRRISP